MKLSNLFDFIKSNKKVNTIENQCVDGLPSIATNPWIEVYFKIFIPFNKILGNQTIENLTKTSIVNSLIEKYRIRIATFIIKNYPTTRAVNVKSRIIHKNVEFLIRFRKRSIEELQHPVLGLLDPVFGYSPIDFIPDKQRFVELDSALCKYFSMAYSFLPITTGKFNNQGEPIIEFRLNTLFTAHRVIDELELYSKCPKIAESCFPNKGIINFIKLNETRVKQDKRWLEAVDSLLDRYFNK